MQLFRSSLISTTRVFLFLIFSCNSVLVFSILACCKQKKKKNASQYPSFKNADFKVHHQQDWNSNFMLIHLLIVPFIFGRNNLFLAFLHTAHTNAARLLLAVQLQGASMLQTGPLIQVLHRFHQLVALQPRSWKMILQVGRTIRSQTHKAGLLGLQLSLRANVAGYFTGRSGVPVFIGLRWLHHLFDNVSQDNVHTWGFAQMLLTQGAHHVVIREVAAQTFHAKGVTTICRDRILKWLHADGANEMLFKWGGLTGWCLSGGHYLHNESVSGGYSTRNVKRLWLLCLLLTVRTSFCLKVQ